MMHSGVVCYITYKQPFILSLMSLSACVYGCSRAKFIPVLTAIAPDYKAASSLRLLYSTATSPLYKKIFFPVSHKGTATCILWNNPVVYK